MHYAFAALGITPESSRRVGDVAQFAFDYTFFMNIGFVLLAGGPVWLHRGHLRESDGGMQHNMKGGGRLKRWVALACIAILVTGLMVYIFQT